MKNESLNDRVSTSRRREAPRWPYVAGILVVAAGIAGMIYLARSGVEGVDEDMDLPPPVAEETARPALPPLPPASETDALVREALKDLSPLGALAGWLASDDLVRRFVGATNQIADGKSPRSQLGFLAPEDRFRVTRRGGRLYMDPRGFTRYDVIAKVITSIDSQRAVTAYAKLEKLLAQAQQELGARDRTFPESLAAAIDHLARAPVPVRRLEVKQGHVLYELAEPQLESLSAAQKHLLRMGPDNMRAVQLKLKELALALRLPPAPETAALER